MENYREIFKEEAKELLAEIESALLELEGDSEDAELVNRIFRAMHTIKGSGSMCGFVDIATFTHEVETVFDLVRNGNISINKGLIDIALRAKDHIRSLLDSGEKNRIADKSKGSEIITSLRVLMPADSKPPEPVVKHTEKKSAGHETVFRIRFKPSPEIFMTGTDPLCLINELKGLGECKVIAMTGSIPLLPETDPEKCYVSWDIILTAKCGPDDIKDIFIFVEDSSAIDISVIDSGDDPSEKNQVKKLGEILVERGDLKEEDLQNALKKQKRIGEVLSEDDLISKEKLESALMEQNALKKLKEKKETVEASSSIRVRSDKLDSLVDLVGELVTVQARLSQTAAGRSGDTTLLTISEEIERITWALRDNTMNIRMLPIGTTFTKFKRLVRDLSVEMGKEVELVTEGAETELDKTVIETLNDPLIHLIRNSIDHGIELPEIRRAAGKPAKGTVHLSAQHSGPNVIIQIKDDGAGLDRDLIYSKAVEKGLVSASAELSEKEIFSLVFAPGFSTAKTITSVSGRGVGMDVVKQKIEGLRGSIGIESQKGAGTTISLKLPLTLAIIDGLLVDISGERFILPLSLVRECIELTEEDIANTHGRNLANVRGHIVPYIRLREKFSIEGEPPDIEQIVITETDSQRIGFAVDNVIGSHQTVIKSLGKVFRKVEGVSGATILGDGDIALILDVHKIVQAAQKDELVLYG